MTSASDLGVRQPTRRELQALEREVLALQEGFQRREKGALEGLRANEERCRQTLRSSTAVVTALVEELGYQEVQRIALEAQQTGRSVRDVVVERWLLTAEQFDALLQAAATTGLGSRGER